MSKQDTNLYPATTLNVVRTQKNSTVGLDQTHTWYHTPTVVSKEMGPVRRIHTHTNEISWQLLMHTALRTTSVKQFGDRWTHGAFANSSHKCRNLCSVLVQCVVRQRADSTYHTELALI